MTDPRPRLPLSPTPLGTIETAMSAEQPRPTDADHATDGHRHDDGDCGDVLAELYTFVDGELTVERRAIIKAHLDECLPCFEAFDFEAELRIVVSQRCREKVPDELRARIARALTDETS
jgi:mycothiol system anti-sigma-R factor